MDLVKVHSGWLTKSPPEKKLQGIFKAQWRRRYFVLSSPPPSSTGGEDSPLAYLHYYDNDKSPKKTRQKGCIDLSNCEEILSQLDSVFYEHVFSLRTKHRGRTRTYYLAADSSEEMHQWTNCLSQILGMDDTDAVPVKMPSSTKSQAKPIRKPSFAITKSSSSCSPASHQQQQPPHLSISLNVQSNFEAELNETRLGLRVSQACYSPSPLPPPHQQQQQQEPRLLLSPQTDPGPFKWNDSASDSPVPPELPAKTRVYRLNQGLDSGLQTIDRLNATGTSDGDLGLGLGLDPDSLGKSFRDSADKECDYDFPPPRKDNGSRSGTPLTDTEINRDSVFSFPDVFDPETSDDGYPDDEDAFSSAFQRTSRTRSFRHSAPKSNPPAQPTQLEPVKSKSSSDSDAEDYEHLTIERRGSSS